MFAFENYMGWLNIAVFVLGVMYVLFTRRDTASMVDTVVESAKDLRISYGETLELIKKTLATPAGTGEGILFGGGGTVFHGVPDGETPDSAENSSTEAAEYTDSDEGTPSENPPEL